MIILIMRRRIENVEIGDRFLEKGRFPLTSELLDFSLHMLILELHFLLHFLITLHMEFCSVGIKMKMPFHKFTTVLWIIKVNIHLLANKSSLSL